MAILILLSVAAPVTAADLLFPEPLHLVRSIGDPLANSQTEIEEYYGGNRAVTIAGRRTTIVDYGARQMTEIDRGVGTYSVSSFNDMAADEAALRRPSPQRLDKQSTASSEPWTVRPTAMKASRSGRSADWYEIDAAGVTRLEIAADREITVSEEALDILTGSAFPAEPGQHSDAIARACLRSPTESSGGRYALPLEQAITFEGDDGSVEFRSSIVRIDHEVPSADLMAIPAGARLVPSRRGSISRSLKDLDSGKSTPNRP